jgi:hypothetical protein
LGVSSFNGINFDLPTLLSATQDLSFLVTPFTKEEIDSVVRNLPSDKAPGSDGFNIDFLRNVGPLFAWISMIYVKLSSMPMFAFKV